FGSPHSQVWTCRCEEVAEGTVIDAIARGAATVSDVKRASRAGMGLCQGIYCGAEIARLLTVHTGVPRETIVPMTARPPVRLITLVTLATLSEPE
ncbi:MAG: (2Fe-2S)-binding protein, partial [Chloroflexota bacterium]|nr:(2Fe-2S)-binding protein [Chloroflexota bacterium]